MMARLRLTTKQVNGGYYKGNRTGSMGRFTKSGYYLVDYKKARTYVVPEGLESFKVSYDGTSFMSMDSKCTNQHAAYSLCHQAR